VSVYDTIGMRTGRKVNVTDKQRNLIVCIEAFPYLCGKGVDIAFNFHSLGLTDERGNGIAVALVGVDEVTFAANGLCVFIEETA